jgi:LmbE family N-acetylglucosaminyl deacetylase
MHSLCILAHPDDEIAMAWSIRRLAQSGRPPIVVFLTDGTRRGTTPEQRVRESLHVLGNLGVPPEHCLFIGAESAIPDGALHRHIDRAFGLLDAKLGTEAISEVLCLAWEGGHQDHDASHLIARAVARARGLEDSVREFPSYRALGGRGPFFRVMSPIPRADPIDTERLSRSEGMRIVAQCFAYRSQWKTWLGLLPGVAVELIGFARSRTRRPNRAFHLEKPHRGLLFYERRFGVSFEDFVRETEPFVDRLLRVPPLSASPIAPALPLRRPGPSESRTSTGGAAS